MNTIDKILRKIRDIQCMYQLLADKAIGLDVNNTPIPYVPALSGNTEHLNSVVTDPAGNKWIIDANGDATKISSTIILDGNNYNIVRVDSTAGVEPTEVSSPINGDTATVFLPDNKIEYWVHNGTSWVLAKTVNPTVLDGNDKHVVRTNTTTGVAPTTTEIPTATLGDTAKVILSNNTVEYWSYNGTAWVLDKTISGLGVITSITNALNDGSIIATYTNEAGVPIDIKQTITSIVEFYYEPTTGVLNITYLDEASVENNYQVTLPLETLTNVVNTIAGNRIATYTNEDNVPIDINETITSISELSITGKTITIKYKDETGAVNVKTVTIPSDVVTTITNTVTGNKIGTYTNEAGVDKDINETVTFFQADYDSYEIGTNNWKTYFHQFQYYDEAGGGEVVNLAIPLTRTNDTPITYVPNSTGSNVLPAHYNTISIDPSGDKWFIDYNGKPTKVTTTFTDVKYSKLVFVDPVNGNDTTGTGSDNKMFKTVTKALSTTDGSGWRVVLAPGTYVENPTVQWPNVDIVTVAGTTRGNTYINGTVTFVHTSSSSGIHGIKMKSLVHAGTTVSGVNTSGSLYVKDCQVDISFSKTCNAYLEVLDSDLTGISITGSGQSVFVGGKQTVLTVNNAAAIVTVNDSINLAVTTVTAGILGVLDTTGFASTANGKAITAAAGTTVMLSNSQFYGSTGLLTGLTLSGNYAIDDVQFDKVNSTLGTNLSTIGWFDKLGIINPTTIATATKVLVRDTNGVVSEQLISTFAGDKYATTSTTCQDISTSSGDITIQVATGLSYIPLQTITMIDATNSANHMHGDIVSYNSTTGALVLNVKQKSGTGNVCNWLVNLDSFNVTATTVVVSQNNTSGNLIGTINVNGVPVTLLETLTSLGVLSYNGTTGVLTIPYTGEDGVLTTRTVTIPVEVITTLTNTITGSKIGTYTNESGVPVDINQTITSIGTISYNSTTGVLTIPYIDEAGVTNEKTVTLSTGLPSGGTDGQVLTVQPNGSYAWESLPDAPVTGGQNVYFNAENPASGTIFDTENPPVTNNDALKEDSANTYYGTDGSVWTWNGTAYVTKVYNFTTEQSNVFTSSAGQTAFVLSKTPIGQLYGYRNGVKLPTAWSWVGTAVTYIPANNGGKTLDASDVISFEYEAY